MPEKQPDLLLVGEEDFAYEDGSAFRNALIHAGRVIGSAAPRLGKVLVATHAAAAGFVVETLEDVLLTPAARWRYGRALARRPLALGISTVAIKNGSTVARLAGLARRISPGTTVILGGQGAVNWPEMRRHADLTVTGYGEAVLPGVLRALKRGGGVDSIPGLKRDALGPLVEGDLYYDAGKPLKPDWGFFGGMNRTFPLEASRGCRFNCSFCNYAGRKRQVFRDPAEVLDEALQDVRKFGASRIDFVDSNFTADPAFTDEFLRLLKASGAAFDWTCLARVDDFARRPGLAGRLAEAGCVSACLGVESIHDDVLRRMRKGYNGAAVAAGLSSRGGLRVHVNFIVGFPGDTAENVRETVEFCRRYAIEEASLSALFVPPALYELAAKDPELYCHLSGTGPADWRHDTMDRAEAVRLAAWARKELNRGRLIPMAS